MDLTNILLNILVILGLIVIPAGVIGGIIGIFTRNKFANHPKENLYTNLSMLIFATLVVSVLVIVVNKC